MTESKKSRKITQEIILANTSLTRASRETTDSYLQRITHLHLQGKRIRNIDGLETCTNLKVLYLYDNQIDRIQNLEFASNLNVLNLQNNFIREIPDLNMPSLQKLFLDDNEIGFVAGLDACTSLISLHISNQRLPPMSTLQFDPANLFSLSNSLETLDISGNSITLLNPFTVLHRLRKFICENNQINDVSEIEQIMSGLPRLEEASFVGNPCCISRTYRDNAIGAASSLLKMFDNVPVQKHQQIAVKALSQHRKKLGFGGFHGEEKLDFGTV